jgi:hypothetical protein
VSSLRDGDMVQVHGFMQLGAADAASTATRAVAQVLATRVRLVRAQPNVEVTVGQVDLGTCPCDGTSGSFGLNGRVYARGTAGSQLLRPGQWVRVLTNKSNPDTARTATRIEALVPNFLADSEVTAQGQFHRGASGELRFNDIAATLPATLREADVLGQSQRITALFRVGQGLIVKTSTLLNL